MKAILLRAHEDAGLPPLPDQRPQTPTHSPHPNSRISQHSVPFAIIVLREVFPARGKPYSLSSSCVRSTHSLSWVRDLLREVGADVPGVSKGVRGSEREGGTHVREPGAVDGGCTGCACGAGTGVAA